MAEHLCPSCQRGKMNRSERRNFLERFIYPFLGKYPWRCKFCRARVMLADRGKRRLYVSEGESSRRNAAQATGESSNQDAA